MFIRPLVKLYNKTQQILSLRDDRPLVPISRDDYFIRKTTMKMKGPVLRYEYVENKKNIFQGTLAVEVMKKAFDVLTVVRGFTGSREERDTLRDTIAAGGSTKISMRQNLFLLKGNHKDRVSAMLKDEGYKIL